MGCPPSLLAATSLLSAAAWAVLAARRAPDPRPRAALRALGCGGVAAGLALAAYQALEAAGLPVRWTALLAGGWSAAGLAAVIGLVEEGAKLVGITLALAAAGQRGSVPAATVGVAAGFAGVESGLVLTGAEPAVALLRALLAPAAHAILAAPLGLAVLFAARGGRGVLAWPALGLLAAAGLHAAADLSLAIPGWGRLGYAATLLAPALALHLIAPGGAPAAVRR